MAIHQRLESIDETASTTSSDKASFRSTKSRIRQSASELADRVYTISLTLPSRKSGFVAEGQPLLKGESSITSDPFDVDNIHDPGRRTGRGVASQSSGHQNIFTNIEARELPRRKSVVPSSRSFPTRSSATKRTTKKDLCREKVAIPYRRSSLVQPATRNNKSTRPDALALYRRSSRLFTSIDEVLEERDADDQHRVKRPNSSSFSTPSTTDPARHLAVEPPPFAGLSFDIRKTPTITVRGPGEKHSVTEFTISSILNDLNNSTNTSPSSSASSVGVAKAPLHSPQIISWTSPASRKAEYAKIDAANAGVRGTLKKMVPRSWRRRISWCSRRNFYSEEDSAGSDDDSVRRFRLSEDGRHPGSAWIEKNRPSVQENLLQPERKRSWQCGLPQTVPWSCFVR